MSEKVDCIEYNNEYLTATQVVAPTPCELSNIIPLAGGNTGDLRVYDGIDANGELKLRIRLPQNTSRPFVFTPHIYFSKAMYVDFTDQIDGCFVQWRMRPHPDK